MEYLENFCLFEKLNFDLPVYIRYVDITILDIHALQKFQIVVDAFYPRIQFTFEIEKNNRARVEKLTGPKLDPRQAAQQPIRHQFGTSIIARLGSGLACNGVCVCVVLVPN